MAKRVSKKLVGEENNFKSAKCGDVVANSLA
jgi:hypothetical protein